MNTNAFSAAALAGALLLAIGAAAGPLPVRTLGTKSQSTVMCPDCKEKISCAKAGDYTIGFSAVVENIKTGGGKIAVHVKDKAGKPVDDAKVVVALDMPKHGHSIKPLTLQSTGHGAYEAATPLVMPGAWRADVEVTPSSGDKVKQAFSFRNQ